MEEPLILPDETLPSFVYLDKLSQVKEEDLIQAIKNWKQKHKGEDLENILEAELINE